MNQEEQYSKQLKELKKQQKSLRKYLNRTNATLVDYLICVGRANRKYLKNALGYSYEHNYRVNVLGDMFLNKEKQDKEARTLKNIVEKDEKYFSQYIENLKKIFRKINKQISKNSWEDPEKELKTRLDLVAQVMPFMTSFLFMEKLIADKVRDFLVKRGVNKKKIQEYIIILLSSSKLDNTTKGEMALGRLQAIYKESDKLDEGLIKDYLNKYAYKTMHWGAGKILDKKELIKMIKDSDTNETNAEKELKERNKGRKELIKKLKLTKKEKDFLEVAREYGFYRNYRPDIFDIVIWKSQKLLKEIAKKKAIKFEDILFYSEPEIFAGKKISKKEIEKRKKFEYVATYLSETGYFITTEKKHIREFQKILYSKSKKEITQIKGAVASLGIAEGIVKKVNTINDIDKVKNGNILVAPMTMPNYLPAMKKAAAFVTDEGGVTCHAAIIAREMGKPCIIGTKIATQILQDGNVVEVDAKKGIVKILKKK